PGGASGAGLMWCPPATTSEMVPEAIKTQPTSVRASARGLPILDLVTRGLLSLLIMLPAADRAAAPTSRAGSRPTGDAGVGGPSHGACSRDRRARLRFPPTGGRRGRRADRRRADARPLQGGSGSGAAAPFRSRPRRESRLLAARRPRRCCAQVSR